jgi:septum formation protein
MTGPRPESLILASGSPRRADLLRELGIPFDIRPAEIDEDLPGDFTPRELALLLAREKARTVSAAFPRRVVLGADTVVCLGDRILGKPRDASEAREILRSLAGTSHTVWTGICLLRETDGIEVADVVGTRVRFRKLSDREIEDYIAGGEPFDKAGGYGIQGGAGEFVTEIEGSRTNVIGLPTERLLELLAENFPSVLPDRLPG